MTNYSVYEGQSVFDELENNSNIQVGDTITYAPNNQMGYVKYSVICKEKGLKKIEDYYDLMDNNKDNSQLNGGKRYKRKRTNKRRKRISTRRRKNVNN